MAFAANRATTPTADQVQPPRRNLSSQCVEQPQRAGAIPCASVRPSSPVCAPVVAGCASSGSSTGWASSPTSAASVNATGPRWSGNHAADRILTGGGQARAFGTVLLAVAESALLRSMATQNRSPPWAILPGGCGAGSLPLIGQDLFPEFEVPPDSPSSITPSEQHRLADEPSRT